jgi:hypothetical protein
MSYAAWGYVWLYHCCSILIRSRQVAWKRGQRIMRDSTEGAFVPGSAMDLAGDKEEGERLHSADDTFRNPMKVLATFERVRQLWRFGG